MIRPKSFLLPFLVLFLLSFAGCLKKGADDPFISFRTRKARMEGAWVMVSGFKAHTLNGYTYQTNYTGNKYEEVRNFKGYIDVFNGDAIFKMEFTKEGQAKIERVLERYDEIKFEGTWSFAGGVGDIKEKEQFVLHNSKTVQNPDLIFYIKELRDKKLVIYRNLKSEDESWNEQFEFKQQ